MQVYYSKSIKKISYVLTATFDRPHVRLSAKIYH